ncbi:energy-coupling factor ABC transporter ATP-binding protein [Corynebacterium bovis]|uniref:ABC transporter ATP-binding protein n=1 Tax=Corynebacterium bovis TaxID=36808 RepID=UPI0031387704
MTGGTTGGGAAVTLRDVGWRPAGRQEPTLRGVDLTVAPGERILLLGPSGAGKSTLLAALAGVLGDGEATGELDVPARAGLVLQDPDSQVLAARVGDDVAFGCENLRVPRDEIHRRVPEALRAVGLGAWDDPTDTLSGGQKQRLALAGVLAMRPGLLLLDEPTANIDPAGVRDLRDAVARVLDMTGATFIVVEHRVEVWQGLVDRAVVLGADGRVVADGPVDDVLADHSLTDLGVWVPGVPLDLPAPPDPPTRGTVVSARDLTVGWDRPVLGHVDLDVPVGATSLVGPNGQGKSTLALTLAGLLRPLEGDVVTPWGPPHRLRSRELVRHIGYVFQDPEHQFIARTVRDELGDRADDLLPALGLEHLAAANPFTLSGGEKRRLSVATALVGDPQLVILDEPTFGQDRTTFRALVTLLHDLVRRGTAVLSVTHDADFAAAMGGRTVEAREGVVRC